MATESNGKESLSLLSDSDDDEEVLRSSQPLLTLKNTTIRDVYQDNFEEEFTKIMKLVNTFNYISMDTEFPGVNYSNLPWMATDQSEHEYHVIKQNVDLSKIIQIGITLSDQHGRVPQGVCTWQFNFEFKVDEDIINVDSRQLLTNAGISFQKLKEKGIHLKEFSEALVASGIVLNNRIRWIVFHGSYDFAYLLKMVHGDGLPDNTEEFYALMGMYYPNIYDIKYFIKDIPSLKDVGLAKLSNEIGCSRIGPQHQAGSDSLLTLSCFFKLKDKKETEHALKNSSYLNTIYGIGKGFIKANNNTNSYARWDMEQQRNYQMQQYQMAYYPHDMYFYYQSHAHAYIYPPQNE